MNKKPSLDLLMASAGNLLASMVLSGLILGYLLDSWLGTTPIFMLGFGALGLFGGFQRVHRLVGAKDGRSDES
jgi:ATP synthase protein I